MSEVGFDVDRLATFATSVGVASPGLDTLDSEIGSLRGRARALMGSTTMPSDARPCTTTIRDLGEDLLDVETEIRRRIQILTVQNMLATLGIPADPAQAFVLSTADPKKVAAGVDAVRDLLGKDCGVNGNRDDIERLQETLAELSPADLDAVVDELSDAELGDLGDLVNDTSDSGWSPFDHNGLERWERMDFYTTFLSQVSPSRIDRIVAAFPGAEPPFDSTDVALDGENAQTGEKGVGIHYGVPEGEVFRLGPDGHPIVDTTQMSQGQLGDCWFIASTLAAQGADPEFIADHMRVNPNGTVSTKMYDGDGDPHWVTVTRDLPLDKDGDPIGAEGSDGLLWGSYYEKAFALAYQDDDGGASDDHQGDSTYDRKEEGSYGALEWDYNDKAAPYITGHGGDDLGHDFDDIRKKFQDGHPVIVSTPSDAPDPPDDWANSYSTRHVYYVTGVTDDTVTVGNPWGSSYPSITMTKDQFDDYFGDGLAMDVKH